MTSVGCKTKPTDGNPSPKVAASSTPSAIPRDALPPSGELRDGKERAYALVLPTEFIVRSSYNKHVLAAGPASVPKLAAYIAKQVGQVPPDSKSRVVLNHVVHPAEPKRPMDITIQQDSRTSGWVTIDVDDLTPPPEPPPDKRDAKSRMEAIGMTPDGRPLHPE